ncbi:MAG: hypothetical protein HC800_22420, partial [Phormidesmis sp. RL_2_1]|nr:hypothetical protein [Phormidesmis sp. RL_2_1]
SGETLRRRTALRNAHQDSGETLRRRTALRNAHPDKVRMHPYFAIVHNPFSAIVGPWLIVSILFAQSRRIQQRLIFVMLAARR